MRLRIGTRGSQLAQWQAKWVAARLGELPEVEVEVIEIRTTGDDPKQSIAGLNAQGVFTKEIQNALLAGDVDVAVHSLKDLPTEPTPGLKLGAVPAREAAGDVLISREKQRFEELPKGAVIGTGSARRRAQLLYARPDLRMADIRGNVDTRLRKLDEGLYDAIVLAEAGLKRLGLTDVITEVFPPTLVLPAVGQGALGIECRADDETTSAALQTLDDSITHQSVLAERALLAALRGGCLAPVGAWGRRFDQGLLLLSAVVLNSDGKQRLFAEAGADPGDAVALGEQVARQLLDQGAAELIAALRQ